MIKPDLKKINEIQDFIMHEEESQWELDDHIYRSYHRSFKISHIRFNAVRYLYICLYFVGKTGIMIKWSSNAKNILKLHAM